LTHNSVRPQSKTKLNQLSEKLARNELSMSEVVKKIEHNYSKLESFMGCNIEVREPKGAKAAPLEALNSKRYNSHCNVSNMVGRIGPQMAQKATIMTPECHICRLELRIIEVQELRVSGLASSSLLVYRAPE